MRALPRPNFRSYGFKVHVRSPAQPPSHIRSFCHGRPRGRARAQILGVRGVACVGECFNLLQPHVYVWHFRYGRPRGHRKNFRGQALLKRILHH